MKFWDKPEITDMKDGLLPTYVTNAGHLLSKNPDEWTEEFKAAVNAEDTAGLVEPDKIFIRAYSRLTYAFGIAFHMTGNKHYRKSAVRVQWL